MMNRALGIENEQYQFLQRDHNICYRIVVFAFTLAAKNLSYTNQKICSDIGLNNGLREDNGYKKRIDYTSLQNE